jgi:hypothetical protein
LLITPPPLAWVGSHILARRERQEQAAAAVAAKDHGIAACKAQYPDENRDFVVRNKCAYEAAKVLPPFSSYPDLFDRSVSAQESAASAARMASAPVRRRAGESYKQLAAECIFYFVGP